MAFTFTCWVDSYISYLSYGLCCTGTYPSATNITYSNSASANTQDGNTFTVTNP